jgi:spore maturation protein CgeB
MDTPVTLQSLARGERVAYLPPDGLGRYDLVLSFTGGAVLKSLTETLGARAVYLLYGHADPSLHRPEAVNEAYRADLSYLGTFAADRQPTLERLFVAPARHRSDKKFLLAGSLYPATFPWTPNIYFIQHLPPAEHPAFFSSSALTLNVTRRAMAENGFCPSGRLFEAAACGTAILSDSWEGLERFFAPGKELLIANTTEEVLNALSLPPEALQAMGKAARARVLEEHTSQARARDLEEILFA